MSQSRQNYHEECEASVNKQINLELYASYVFHSLTMYFERDDVALPGFAKYFKKLSDQERDDAEKLMAYQNQRGGHIVLQDVKKPAKDDWGTGVEAMEVALELAKQLNQAIIDLHDVAGKHGDAHLDDFVEDAFMEKQVKLIKELADHVTNLKRVGSGLGEYQFDKLTLGDDSGCEGSD